MEQTEPQQAKALESQSTIPPLPAWPTSKPGPKVTEPPLGQKRMTGRTEQVTEVNYDQEHGKSNIRDEAK